MAQIANVRKFPSRELVRGRKEASPFEIDQVWIDREVANHPQTIRILNKLEGVPVDVIDNCHYIKRSSSIDGAKRQLLLAMHRGQAFKPCQGIGNGHVCCNYRVIDIVSGCPMDCSYCVLQSYLSNNPVTTIYVNCESILAEIGAFLSGHSGHFYRIGTGELSDSLALDYLTEYSSILIPFFASQQNAILELKTKTASVDSLLNLRHGGRTVISWSVGTQSIIASEERGTATLEERLAAAAKAVAHGFGVGFHFDPIILTPQNGIDDYLHVVDMIFDAVEPSKISWVSLGLLRFPPDLLETASKRFPGTKIFSGEFVPAGGKFRYLRFIREKTYRAIWEKLARKLTPAKIYLCMETPLIWEKLDPSVKSNPCLEKKLGDL